MPVENIDPAQARALIEQFPDPETGRPLGTMGQVKSVAVNDGKVEPREGHGEFVARKAGNPVNRALSSWKELTAPRPVSRTGIPASGV